MFDPLSAELVREIWRYQKPVLDLQLSAVTAPSVDGLRAYLRGEQFYRGSQWDSAREVRAYGGRSRDYSPIVLPAELG